MPRAYLADLRQNYHGVMSVDVMPLGIGFMKAVMDRDVPGVESRLFAYPDRLIDAITSEPPDVLMLSNYCWNEALSLAVARRMKRIRPATLVVMGGPNLHLEDDRKIEYVARHPELDVYAMGEADFLAADIVTQFQDAGLDLGRFRERPIDSSLYRRPDSSVALTPVRDRRRDLDAIPSPWTTGVMDSFFDGKLSPTFVYQSVPCRRRCT